MPTGQAALMYAGSHGELVTLTSAAPVPVAKTCSVCKYWDADPEDHFDARAAWGNCGLAFSDDGEPMTAGTQAVAMDNEAYSAHLETAPTFGCIQWEPRT
jgi:hypothetical protein